MEFSFDIRGHLKPYGKNRIEEKELKKHFVDPFNGSSTRKKLYEGFLRYNADLQQLLNNQHYVQWINGSFISTKINPRDIDLVNLIDYKLVSTYETELKRFTTSLGKEEYGVDGYIVKVYPEEHKEYMRMESTLIYWQNWFSTSRRNRSKKRFPKGFVESDHQSD